MENNLANRSHCVKIRDNTTGLYRNKNGSYGKFGKAYSTLGYAKNSITNSLSTKDLNSSFVIFKDNGIEYIPVIEHIIVYVKKKNEYWKKWHLNIILAIEQ